MSATGVEMNRTSISLPSEVSNEILQKTQEDSAIMQLARKVTLPGRGLTIPMITSDPEAAWVGETAQKPVSKAGLDTKLMSAYKLAVIVPFSMEFRRDMANLYSAMVERLPRSLAKKFDATVMGVGSKPGDNFDNFASATVQMVNGSDSASVYGALVDADTDIAAHGGILNGFMLSPQAKGVLLGETDTTGRPIFVNNVSEGAIPMLLGSPVKYSKGAYVAGKGGTGSVAPLAPVPDTLGVAGDWTQAMYGTVEGVQIGISDQATLTFTDELEQTVTVNLWQQNMFAVRAEIEIGFRADISCFNKIGRTHVE